MLAFLGSGPENDTSVYIIDEWRACWLPRDCACLRFYTLEIPKKVETYEVVETIKHEETNPILLQHSLSVMSSLHSLLYWERGKLCTWWKAGPWHFGGVLSNGWFLTPSVLLQSL